MARTTADKSRLLAVFVGLMWFAACAGTSSPAFSGSSAHAAAASNPDPADQKDKKKAPPAPSQAAPAPGPSKPTPGSGGSAEAPTQTWSLVLGTFTGDDHAQAAHNMLGGLRKIAPAA